MDSTRTIILALWTAFLEVVTTGALSPATASTLLEVVTPFVGVPKAPIAPTTNTGPQNWQTTPLPAPTQVAPTEAPSPQQALLPATAPIDAVEWGPISMGTQMHTQLVKPAKAKAGGIWKILGTCGKTYHKHANAYKHHKCDLKTGCHFFVAGNGQAGPEFPKSNFQPHLKGWTKDKATGAIAEVPLQ